MVENDLKMYELYDLWYKPFWHNSKVLLSIIIMSLLCIVAIIYWFWKKRTRTIKILTPWEMALQELNALDPSLLHEVESHRLFYGEITSILKKYFIKRYQLDLTGKTDAEMIILLQKTYLPVDLHQHLERLLKNAELAKFAHADAQSQMRYDLLRSVDIVRNSMPNNQSSKEF